MASRKNSGELRYQDQDANAAEFGEMINSQNKT